MALDPSLALRCFRPSGAIIGSLPFEWDRLCEDLQGHQWAIHKSGTRLTSTTGQFVEDPTLVAAWTECLAGRWLIIPPDAGMFVARALGAFLYSGGNGYAILQNAGALVAKAESSIPELTGGSYCRTELLQHEKYLRVRKSITANQVDFVDSNLKMFREEEMLRTLPACAAEVFLPVLGSGEVAGQRYFDTPFVFGYTLGELIWQHRISADTTVQILRDLFARLKKNLYGRPHPSGQHACQEPDIMARVLRRFDIMRTSPVSQEWARLLSHNVLVINGREYEGWPCLERWLREETKVLEALRNGPDEWCHGDLIFDDMIVDQSRLVLVDPNGDAASRLYDVGKILLSAWSYYEMFKYDRFSCTVSDNNIWLAFAEDSALDVLDRVADDLPRLWRDVTMWDLDHPEPDGFSLLLRNGLHNLSLPMFHLTHHQNAVRATAFLALGIIRLNQAVQEFQQGKSTSLSETTNRYCLREVITNHRLGSGDQVGP